VASLHADILKQRLEEELAALPPDGNVTPRLTASNEDGLSLYGLEMPNDTAARHAHCHAVSSRLQADHTLAAGFGFTTIVRGSGHELACVIASDCNGSEEAWNAQIVRSHTTSPRVTHWESVAPAGSFFSMLRAGLAAVTG